MPERLIASSSLDVAVLASGSTDSVISVSSEQSLNLASGEKEKVLAAAAETVSVLGSIG